MVSADFSFKKVIVQYDENPSDNIIKYCVPSTNYTNTGSQILICILSKIFNSGCLLLLKEYIVCFSNMQSLQSLSIPRSLCIFSLLTNLFDIIKQIVSAPT